MINKLYNLPDISFIGGDSFPIIFTLFKDEAQCVPFELDNGMTAYFSVTHYANRDYTSTTFSLSTEDENSAISYQDAGDGFNNLFVVQIPTEKTIDLFGKYIYQITLVSEDGQPEILGQGIMDIIRNIDKSILIY